MSSERESLQLCHSEGQGLAICPQASRFFLHHLVELLPSLLPAALQGQRLPEDDTAPLLRGSTSHHATPNNYAKWVPLSRRALLPGATATLASMEGTKGQG